VEAGFRGKVYPINPGLSELMGLTTYPSISALPGDVDLAIIAIPAELSVSVIEECISRGLKGAVIITSGFGEVGTEIGADLQAKMRYTANKGGIKIIGPNTLGLVNTRFKLNATFNPTFSSIKTGNVALITQSGGTSGYISNALHNHNIGLSKLIGLGNRCNLDFPEILSYLAQDKETDIIIMYIEGAEQPRQLIKAASEVVKRKPIVVFKGGRGEVMNSATLSHTGALAGKYEFYKAAFTQAGMIDVDSITELVDTVKALAFQPPSSGNRVAVLSVQAGPAIIIADRCRELGLKLAEFSIVTRQKLRQLISPLNPIDNPVDIAWQHDKLDPLRAMLEVTLQDEGVDAVIVASVYYTGELTRAVTEIGQYSHKPIIACHSSFGGGSDDQQKALEENHIPTYPLPDRAVTGLAGLVRYGEILKKFD
jgi:acetyltransferase